MSPFTDDDLAVLKEILQTTPDGVHIAMQKSKQYWTSLLARLEAAEVCANHSQSCYGYEAWRKAKGE